MGLFDGFFAIFGFYPKDATCQKKLDASIIKTDDLQKQLTQAQQDNGSISQITQLQATIENSQAQLIIANNQIETLQSAIDICMSHLEEAQEPQAEAPLFLDQTKNPYLPYFQFFSPTGVMEGTVWDDPRDMYSPTIEMREIIANSGYEKMSRYDRLMLGWKLTVGCYAYKSDTGDNHQLPVQTRARGRGDCEDFARLVIAFWRLLKIVPDGVFNTTGNTNFGYHDWPIAFLTDEEIKGTPVEKHGAGWYIYEATLTYKPPCPMPLKGSRYYVVDGLENWAFKGKVKKEFGSAFQLAAGATPGFQQTIDNHKEKEIEINKYQHDWHTKHGHHPPKLTLTDLQSR